MSGKPLSLMFVNKAGAYSSGATFKDSILKVFYKTYPQTLEQAENLAKDNTSFLLRFVNYDRKSKITWAQVIKREYDRRRLSLDVSTF